MEVNFKSGKCQKRGIQNPLEMDVHIKREKNADTPIYFETKSIILLQVSSANRDNPPGHRTQIERT